MPEAMPGGARLADGGELTGERADEGRAVGQGRLGAEAVEVEMQTSEEMQISEEMQTS